ncbi:MAG: DUF4230 domain-containing protein [Eubacterium sp.]|nr:DUF4230 domain-containing protein [Eubacterium sp.]
MKNKNLTNRITRFCAGFLMILSVTLTGCSHKSTQSKEQPPAAEQLTTGQLRSVCELATLECYYHNTAKSSTDKKVLFWNTNKKLWMEYSGIVKIGIDISRLDLQITGQVVTITLPEAKIISCKIDETSLSEDTFYTEQTGLGAEKITAQDQTEAFEKAQQTMLEEAQKDESLLLQAQERARTLLLNYVNNIADTIGTEYEVRWEIVKDDTASEELGETEP